MKSWEDILKGRFARHAEPGKPGQDEALWNAIESGHGSGPVRAPRRLGLQRACPVLEALSGHGPWAWPQQWVWSHWACCIGPLPTPSPRKREPKLSPRTDAPTPAMTALDSEGEEGTPSISEVAAQDAAAEAAANTATAVETASNEPASNEPASHQADLTLPAAAAMAPEVSVAQPNTHRHAARNERVTTRRRRFR